MEKNELTTFILKLVKKVAIGLMFTSLFIAISIFVPVLPLKIVGAIFSAYLCRVWYITWKTFKGWTDTPPKTIGEKFDEFLYDSEKDDLT